MSHRHFCDVAGHYWECDGVRPGFFGAAPSPCICFCGTSPEVGDHSDCPVELRACPEHKKYAMTGLPADESVPEPGEGLTRIKFPPDYKTKAKRAVKQAQKYGAACFWCGQGYEEYSRALEDEHFAHYCPEAPEQLKQIARKRIQEETNRRNRPRSCRSRPTRQTSRA
jgi:hypothetical protein